MKPSIALDQNRDAVREIASRFGIDNPRVFGSALRGNGRADCGLDLLAEAEPV